MEARTSASSGATLCRRPCSAASSAASRDGTDVRKIIKYAWIFAALVVVAALSAALLYRKYLQHEAAEACAINSPAGINNLERVRIGGIDQWIQRHFPFFEDKQKFVDELVRQVLSLGN